jgi:ATP-dependent Clp protease, protease subunit
MSTKNAIVCQEKEPPAGPDFSEGMKKMFVGAQIQEQMLKRREIFLWGGIDDDSAKEVVQKILFFDGTGNDDITLPLNSPGGIISAGLAVYDAMQYSKSDIKVVCMGQAASMGAVLLCAGTKGKRVAWKNARVLIHQPLVSGNMFGPASDLQIQAEEMLRIREGLNGILAHHTGQPMKKIEQDTDRDYFMSAVEAKEYGIIDAIL